MYRNREILRAGDYLAILVIAILFIPLSLVYEFNQLYSGDQLQMALKGFHAFFNDEYRPFGNEASTMGNVPGTLSSWLIGFPLKLYAGVESVIALQLIIRLMAVFIFANALSQIFSRAIVVLGTFLFALSPWYLYHTMIYNPAYIHFGSAIVLNCLIRLRVENKHTVTGGAGRLLCSMFMVLGTGFILQLHYSWTVVAALCFFMWLRRDIKVSYVGIFIGLAIFFVSLIPYIQEVMVNPSLLHSRDAYSVDRYLGYGFTHVYPVLKGILYWLRFGSFMITNKAITPNDDAGDIEGVWEILSWGWIGIASVIGVATVLFSAYSNYFVIARFGNPGSSERLHFVRGLTISSLLAVILASGASPIVLNFWQISVLLPFALLPVLAFISVRNQYIKIMAVTGIIFFTLANAVAAMHSDKFYYGNHLYQNFYQDCLRGFGKDKCVPFAAHLTPEQLEESQKKIPEPVPGLIDLIINGNIPLPPGAEGADKPAGDDKQEAASAADAAATTDGAPAEAAPAGGAPAEAAPADSAAAAAAPAAAPAAQPAPNKAEADKAAAARAAEAEKAAAKAKADADARAKAEAESKAKADARAKTAAEAKAKAEAEKTREVVIEDRPSGEDNSAQGEIVIDTSDAASGELIIR